MDGIMTNDISASVIMAGKGVPSYYIIYKGASFFGNICTCSAKNHPIERLKQNIFEIFKKKIWRKRKSPYLCSPFWKQRF